MMPQAKLMPLAILAVLGPALACVAPRSMAALYLTACVITLVIEAFQTKTLPRFDKRLLAGAIGFTAYGLLSQIWTINPHETWGKAIELGSIFAVTSFMVPFVREYAQTLGRSLYIGLWAGLAVYGAEIATDHFLYDFVRSGSNDIADIMQNKAVYLLAIWTYLAYPYYGRTPAFYVAALIMAGFTFTSPSASAEMVLVGIPALVLALRFLPIKFCLRLTLIAAIAIVTLMPLVATTAYKHLDMTAPDINTSILSRIEIWNQAAERVTERPLLGWGLDTAPVLPNRGEVSDIPAYHALGAKISHLHPHNGPLQIWFEMGGIGIAALCALFVLFYTRIENTLSLAAQRYGCFMWPIVFLYTLSIWGIWQSWFICSLCFAGLMTGAGMKAIEDRA